MKLADPALDAIRDAVLALRVDIARLEAKIDSKPSLMAMFTGIVVVVFGMAGVVASTVATLHGSYCFHS